VKKLKKDFLLILVSLLLSVMLWTYVQSQLLQKTQVQETFHLLTVNLDQSSLIITKKPDTVKVTAEGSPEAIHDLGRANSQSLNAYVDLSNAQPGISTYPVFIQRDSVRDYGISYSRPDKVVVVIEKRVLSAPKKVEADVEPPNGYAVASVDVTPSSVIIAGPQNDINRIAKVRAHVTLKTDATAGQLIHVKVDVLDEKDKPIPNLTVEPSTVDLTPVLTEAVRRKNVPILFNWSGTLPFGYNIGSDYSVRPSQVAVSGPPEVLKKISSVTTEPISLKGLTSDSSRTVRLKSPGEGVELNPRSVRVFIPVVPPKAPPEDPKPPVQSPTTSNPSPVKQ
jgi:YbbR domain-containing protein